MKAREEVMAQLETKWGVEFVRDSEDFGGQTEGIWMSAENGEEFKGRRLFDYYTEDYANYTFGVHNKIHEWAEKQGYYFSYRDPGTIFLWPN